MTVIGDQRAGPDAAVIAEAIPHLVWTAGPDGGGTYINDQGTAYTGCPREANSGWNWVTGVHPEDASRAANAYRDAVAAEIDYYDEFRIRRYDGAYRWHAFRARPLRNECGAVEMWIGTATDIDDQKRLELRLRQQQHEATQTLALLRAVEDAAPVGFKLVDRDLRIVRINDRLARVSGCSAESLIGQTVEESVPQLWPQLREIYARALSGETITNVELSGPDTQQPGRVMHWLGSYYPLRINNEIVGVGNVVVEITEHHEAEQALANNLSAMVETIAATVEARDPYTAGHQQRVAEIAVVIAEQLRLAPADVEGIRTAARIHDLGKISIPAEVLSKPGRLSPVEYELIKQHAETGYRIISGIDFPWPVAEMIRQHHERIDGSGYPKGLYGSEILLGSQIIAVADVVEAMTAHRPYRPGHGAQAAMQQLQRDRGATLNREVVDACLAAFNAGNLSPVWQ